MNILLLRNYEWILYFENLKKYLLYFSFFVMLYALFELPFLWNLKYIGCCKCYSSILSYIYYLKLILKSFGKWPSIFSIPCIHVIFLKMFFDILKNIHWILILLNSFVLYGLYKMIFEYFIKSNWYLTLLPNLAFIRFL